MKTSFPSAWILIYFELLERLKTKIIADTTNVQKKETWKHSAGQVGSVESERKNVSV